MNQVLRAHAWLMTRIADGEDRDRGDVPGWVMVTVMSALLVVGLLVIFRGQVETLVRNAFSSIK